MTSLAGMHEQRELLAKQIRDAVEVELAGKRADTEKLLARGDELRKTNATLEAEIGAYKHKLDALRRETREAEDAYANAQGRLRELRNSIRAA